MKVDYFENLPALSQERALEILSTPPSEIDLSSDYYKAVFHLLKYPGRKTEDALIRLIRMDSDLQSVLIAKRKAVEILARLKCFKAIPYIASCLLSSDPYLVENSALSLSELNSKDKKIHEIMLRLLDDNSQNRRALIQSISRMNVFSALPKIRKISEDIFEPPGVRGASIAAVSKLTGNQRLNYKLEEFLLLPNQNDRHCAVQDVINSGDKNMLIPVLKAPVSPIFRIRAIQELCFNGLEIDNNLASLEHIDFVIRDLPEELTLVHSYDQEPSNDFLIEELFGTDFSRAYLAIMKLANKPTKVLWSLIDEQLIRFSKDYGALYFFSILFRLVNDWNQNNKETIIELYIKSLNSSWPKYMKFRHSAINTIIQLDYVKCYEFICNWLDEDLNPFWVCRYSTLYSLGQLLQSYNSDKFKSYIKKGLEDSHPMVQAKALSICNKFQL